MKKGYLFILLFSFVFCRVHGQADIEKEIISDLITEEFNPEPDETVINKNVQNENLTDQKKDSIIIISESYTRVFNKRVDSLEKFHRIGLTGLDLYTMNDFFKKNQSSGNISKFYPDKIKIIYMSQKEWDSIMEKGGWRYYHSIYGSIPTIHLSRPGINESMNKAFIYYDARSDKMGGAGFYIILEKVNDKWIIKEKTIAWMS